MAREDLKGNPVIEAIKEIFRYRELMYGLAWRDIKVYYKQTFLGAAWAIFPALITMLIFTFVNKAKIISIDTGDIPYPIFAYCGLLPWTLFSTSLNHATSSLVNYAEIINKIYFPRAIVPFSVILSKMINFFIASIILVALMIFYRVELHITLLAVPLILFIQVIFTAAISLFLSAGHLFYRDIGYVIGGVLPILMFVTPVVYPIKVSSPQLQGILTVVNPMIPIIDAYRDLILKGVWPDLSTLAIPICLCFGLFIIGIIWFYKIEHLFAENV
jgi:ABC-type polysaccharide/polyol phosphate export permease